MVEAKPRREDTAPRTKIGNWKLDGDRAPTALHLKVPLYITEKMRKQNKKSILYS